MDVGTLVAGRYEVLGSLACGGMADVLVAHDRRLQRDVALKVARATATTDRARFDAEIRLLASLQHPHLVRMFDAGVHEGDAFLVLELADGPTLGAQLCSGPVSDEQWRALGRDLAGALAHVHDRGIVHRDVKPANVLTAADGRWLLADFGIARLLDATGLTATGTAVGTPAYLAPEQVTGGCATSASDVYALGLVLLEAATGRPAFAGDWREAARARLTEDPDLSGVPASWRPLLAAMTARDPADRPTAAEVHERLTVVEPTGATAPAVVAAGSPAPPLPAASAEAPHATGVVADRSGPTSALTTAEGARADDPRPDDAPADLDGGAAIGGSTASPRRLAAVAAVLLVAVLGGLTWLRVGADDATASPVPSPTTTAPAATPTTTAGPTATVAVAVAATVPTTAPSTTTTTAAEVATSVPPTTVPVPVSVTSASTGAVGCPPDVTTTVVEPAGTVEPDGGPDTAAGTEQTEPAAADC